MSKLHAMKMEQRNAFDRIMKKNPKAILDAADKHAEYTVTSSDQLVIGTPGKKGELKVNGDFNNYDNFKLKIDNAVKLRKYANDLLRDSEGSD